MEGRIAEIPQIKSTELTISRFAFGGRAIGTREDGKICFVRGAIPGERVRVHLTSDKKNYSEGCLDEILKPSPLRLIPECPNACPGCSYSHIPYSMELEWKERQLRSFAEKAHLKSSQDDFLMPPEGASARTGWRNKIRLSLEFQDHVVHAGYRDEDNRTLIEVTDCPLAVPRIREALQNGKWKQLLTGEEKTVTFRDTEKDGLIIFFDNHCDKELHEELSGYGEFTAGASSFFQINRSMSGKLAETVVNLVSSLPIRKMVELYCGCGCFSILCAEKIPALQTFGIELDKISIRYAQQNAVSHDVGERCSFQAGDSAATFRRKYPHGVPPGTLVLVDPPRTGLDAAARKLISGCKADYLIYVSCSPDTLFRDLAELEQGAWRICKCTLLDMFPSTAHFETVTLCERG